MADTDAGSINQGRRKRKTREEAPGDVISDSRPHKRPHMEGQSIINFNRIGNSHPSSRPIGMNPYHGFTPWPPDLGSNRNPIDSGNVLSTDIPSFRPYLYSDGRIDSATINSS
jgi:hypothetical protein